MNNLYHPDIYKFDTPIKSYWEDTSNTNFNLEKLNKDTSSEIVVIGGGYTGLSCAINLIENYNLDVILVDAGKIGWERHLEMVDFAVSPQVKCHIKKCKKFMEEKKQENFLKIQLRAQIIQRISLKIIKLIVM